MTAPKLADRARGTGVRARRALRRLLHAGDHGDQHAIDAVWDLWFAEPADDLWTALDRWRRPRTGGGQSLVALGVAAAALDVVAAARRGGHPVAAVARDRILAGQQELVDATCAAALADDVLAAFCAEHGLAPAEPRRAAVFFLLTGRLEHYRHADPDHSLLATAYRAADREEQARIRRAAAADPDVVRVLADTVRRGPLSPEESRYLVDSFAARRDWPGLWDLAKDLPVADAVDVVGRFGDWRPDGPDADLFDTLAGIPPGTFRTAHAAVASPWTGRLPLADVTHGSFSPDGERIAVAGVDRVSVFTVPHGPPVEVALRPATNVRGVVTSDDGRLTIAGERYLERGQPIRRTGGLPRIVAFAPTADGVATLVAPHKEQTVSLNLLPDDGEPRGFSLSGRLGDPTVVPPANWNLAVEPTAGWVAIAGPGLHVATVTSTLDWVGQDPIPPGPSPSLAFLGPDRLVSVTFARVLRVWRLSAGGMSLAAERQLGQIAGAAYPVALPALGAIAVIDAAGDTWRQVRFLDAETLADLPTPKRLAHLAPTCLVASRDGTKLAVGGNAYVAVTGTRIAADVTDLADRPLAAMSPADLRIVHAQLGTAATDPAARPFLDVLYACLVHRFAVDVAIGDAAPVAGRGDDIALGGSA